MAVSDLEDVIEQAASLLELLAHPARLRIMCILQEGECSVLELARLSGLSQPAVSHHLKKLRLGGLARTRRDAQTIYYSIQGKEAVAIMSVLHDLYCNK